MCLSQLFEDLPVLVMGGVWVTSCDPAMEGSSVLEGAEDVNTEIWERALAGAVGTEAVDEAREERWGGAGGGVGGRGRELALKTQAAGGQGEWPRQELLPQPRGPVCPLWVCGRKGGQCAWKPPEKGTDRARG